MYNLNVPYIQKGALSKVRFYIALGKEFVSESTGLGTRKPRFYTWLCNRLSVGPWPPPLCASLSQSVI